MKIVIDIPEEDWKFLKESDGCRWSVAIIEGIINGTPLPKGHGKIGDLDALREEVSSWGMNDYEPSDFIDVIDQADTIIDADKAESEDKLDGDPIDIDKAIEHYEGTLETLKGVDLEVNE